MNQLQIFEQLIALGRQAGLNRSGAHAAGGIDHQRQARGLALEIQVVGGDLHVQRGAVFAHVADEAHLAQGARLAFHQGLKLVFRLAAVKILERQG